MDIAVMVQDDALTADYEDDLWYLANGLDAVFLGGLRLPDSNDDARFNVNEIVDRFAPTTTTADAWDIVPNNINVESNSVSYTDQTTGLTDMVGTLIPNALDTLDSPTDGDIANALIAREEVYKLTTLESATTGLATVQMNLTGSSERVYDPSP